MVRSAHVAQAQPGLQRHERAEVRRSVPRSRILIIDDEASFGRTLALLLRAEHEVIVETSGEEALNLLKRDDAFDLVLCDLALPDLPGPSLYQAILHHNPELAGRFVFATGGAYTPTSREFLKSFPGTLLEKPFHLVEIDRALTSMGASTHAPSPESGPVTRIER